jgi:hypothetical protein
MCVGEGVDEDGWQMEKREQLWADVVDGCGERNERGQAEGKGGAVLYSTEVSQ